MGSLCSKARTHARTRVGHSHNNQTKLSIDIYDDDDK